MEPNMITAKHFEQLSTNNSCEGCKNVAICKYAEDFKRVNQEIASIEKPELINITMSCEFYSGLDIKKAKPSPKVAIR